MADKQAQKAHFHKRSDKQDIIDVRRARVLELHSKGKTVREIADSLLVGKSTVQEDIQYIRDQAAAEIHSHIEDLPYHHKRALTIADLVLKDLFAYFEKDSLELNERLDVIKMILEATEFRARLFTDSGIIDKAAKHAESLKKELADLKKKTQPAPRWSVETELDESGKVKEKSVRKLTKKKKAVQAPIV